jgi:GntR family transcriptional regulator
MLLSIDPHDGLAIYDQVVRQVKYAVADGALHSGELVPSVRQLARQLAINPNTVARAYQQLQQENVLEAVRGTGLAVARGAQARCRRERVKLIRVRFNQVMQEAGRSGLSIDELRQLFEETIAEYLQGHPT